MSYDTEDHPEPASSSARGPSKPESAWLVLGSEVVLFTIFSALGVFALVTLAGGAVGSGYGSGAALGVFCALWGGPGFGVMVACALHALRAESAEAEAAVAEPQRPASNNQVSDQLARAVDAA
jgi:hypothetical protein